MIGNLNSIFKQKIKLGGVTYDTGAQAYFTANTAITTSADKNAINTFYLGLKTDGIYTKLKVMHFYIWGSASACKWNLVNPVDSDAAFRGTFATGFTYGSGGITGNGTSAYVDTYYIPSSNTTQNSAAYGIYSRTNRATASNIYAMGVTETSPSTRQTSIRLRQTDIYMGQVNDASNGTIACTDTRGFFQVSRITSTNRIQGINNTFNTVTSTSAASSGSKIFVMARNASGTAAGYDTVEIPFYYAASGLTQTEMSNFYTRVNTLMTYFGINV
jgi:hypothetical protein